MKFYDPIPGCISTKNYDEIIPRLFLGNYQASLDKNFLEKNNIKYIIRVIPEFHNLMFYNVKYIHVPMKDDLICGYQLDGLFNFISDLIYNILVNTNSSILIHCKKGHHRSANMVAAFLIKYRGYSFNEAFNHINKIRPCALRRETCIGIELNKYYSNRNISFYSKRLSIKPTLYKLIKKDLV